MGSPVHPHHPPCSRAVGPSAHNHDQGGLRSLLLPRVSRDLSPAEGIHGTTLLSSTFSELHHTSDPIEPRLPLRCSPPQQATRDLIRDLAHEPYNRPEQVLLNCKHHLDHVGSSCPLPDAPPLLKETFSHRLLYATYSTPTDPGPMLLHTAATNTTVRQTNHEIPARNLEGTLLQNDSLYAAAQSIPVPKKSFPADPDLPNTLVWNHQMLMYP